MRLDMPSMLVEIEWNIKRACAHRFDILAITCSKGRSKICKTQSGPGKPANFGEFFCMQ